jgi:hypothetical protein
MTIDASYVPGFNYTRNPQVRVVKDFDDKKLWVGVSAESPQANISGLGTTYTSATVTSAANTSSFQGNLSTDVAPDVVAKVAYDPGWGHYEAFGLARVFHDTVGTNVHNNYYLAGGGGAGAILPVVPKLIDVQANMMVGQGIGRYGAAQLPDFSIAPNGSLKPLSEYTALFGVVGHPTPTWDTYLYAGLEQEFRHDVGRSTTAYGYGNFLLNNAGCNTIGGSCSAQTSSVWQITPGVWHRVYDGNYGKMQVGLQDSWTRRNTFSGSNGIAPHGIENITMLSLRYYPF